MPSPTRHPARQAILGIACITFSWFWLQWTHEAGHVIAGYFAGAELDGVVLDPRTISRTDFVRNPHPLITVWGGPVLGTVLGAAVPFLATIRWRSFRPVAMLIAAIILIGNGAYIGFGAAMPVGDAEEMRALGNPPWLLATFGVLCIVPARSLTFRAIACLREQPEHMYRTAAGLTLGAAVLAAAGMIYFPK